MGAAKVEQQLPEGLALADAFDQGTHDPVPDGRSDADDDAVNVERQDGELTEVQRRAAILMALGMSNAEIARHVGREPHTIGRWKQLEAFKRLVKAAGDAADLKVQAERMQFMAQLSELKLETLPVWRELLRDDDPGIRLKAAEAIGKL